MLLTSLGLKLAFLEENALEVNVNIKDWDEVNSNYKDRLKNLISCNLLRGYPVEGGVEVKPNQTLSRLEAVALVDRLYALMYAK